MFRDHNSCISTKSLLVLPLPRFINWTLQSFQLDTFIVSNRVLWTLQSFQLDISIVSNRVLCIQKVKNRMANSLDSDGIARDSSNPLVLFYGLWVLVRTASPRRFYEYPQSMFWAEIWKISDFFIWKFFSFWRWIFLHIWIGVFS